MTRQELLDALLVERFAPRPERPAHNEDGPSAQALPLAVVIELDGRRSA